MLVAVLLVLVNLAGLWTAQRAYPSAGGERRDTQWIQRPSGTFTYRWATPLAEHPAPLADVIHLQLYVQPSSDGKLTFRPRDFLKFGQLFLDGGNWNGTHIIDAAWLRAVATKRSTIEGEIGDYGWGWHLYTFAVKGKKISAIGAGGNGGQLLFVFPQLDMTLMMTAANYGQYPVWRGYIEKLVPDLLACVERSS